MAKGRPGPDPFFMPSRSEMYERGGAIRWMRTMGWGDRTVESVMTYDNPSLDTVTRLVYFYGPEKALQLIEDFNGN